MTETKKEYDKFTVVIEDNYIKVKSDIKDWREEEGTGLDKVTRELEKKCSVVPNIEGCLIAYSCDNNAEETIKNLPPMSSEKVSTKEEQGSKEERNSVDNRKNVELSDVEEKSINDLFEIKLNLPSYQRPYRWVRKNIDFFWNDIRNLLKTKVSYDFGIIVLHRKNKNSCEYDIVDGQQRLVTLSLILKALSSSVADSFINNTTLQGKDSEKNIGYNFQWFRRQVALMDDNAKKEMEEYILNSYADIVVMDDLDDALKFFDRTNTTGVPLTNTDILKSYHLLALSECMELSKEAKDRWEKEGFSKECLEDIHQFKTKVVNKWESLSPWWLNKNLSMICALRMMKEGRYPYGTDDIEDIEQFKNGENKEGLYSGLDSPIANGEFFFWYVFRAYKKFDKIYEEGSKHALKLKKLFLGRPRAEEVFDLLVFYIQEKFFKEKDEDIKDKDIYNKLVDLVFSWLVYYCLYNDSVRFDTIRNSAMEADSLFNAIVSSKKIEDCFDCYCENPLEHLEREGWGNRADGNGIKYLIRRELRRIYG